MTAKRRGPRPRQEWKSCGQPEGLSIRKHFDGGRGAAMLEEGEEASRIPRKDREDRKGPHVCDALSNGEIKAASERP